MNAKSAAYLVTGPGFWRAVRGVDDAVVLKAVSPAEALTRLAPKVDVMTLARVSGHKDIKILFEHYYRETAQDIAARL